MAGHPQMELTSSICALMAQKGLGSFSFDGFGTACWSVYGMAIQINPIINSIMEGAMITNINFNTRAAKAAAPNSDSLPGPKGSTVGAAQGFYGA